MSYFMFGPSVCSPPSWESIGSFCVLGTVEGEGEHFTDAFSLMKPYAWNSF